MRRRSARRNTISTRARSPPNLQLEKLLEGMFYTAGELFGFRFLPVDPQAVPVYHPDVAGGV